MSGIYIHIPYCRKACHYCDFHFSTNLSTKDKLIDAVVEELKLRKDYLDQKEVQTIYFGGGTPSLLSEKDLHRILETIYSHFTVSKPEITLEANPEDLTLEKSNELAALQINRLSIGLQSFNDDYLKLFNRNHDASTSLEAIKNARLAGFKNISIDLIFGIPNQSVEMLRKELKQVIELDTEHISLYGLTIEEGTVFENWNKNGLLGEIDEEIAAHQFKTIMDELASAGYLQYEISNFCKPAFKSKHNSSYWEEKHYLGIGPGAHSFNGTSREYNIKNNIKYIRSISGGSIPSEIEYLSDEDKINEAILISLRTSSGVDLQSLHSNLNFDLLKNKKTVIEEMIASEHLLLAENHLSLTSKGILVADNITERLTP